MNDAEAVVAAKAAQQEGAAAAAKERRAAKKKARAGSSGPQPKSQSSRKPQDTAQEQLNTQKGKDNPLQPNSQALRPLPEPEPEPEPGVAGIPSPTHAAALTKSSTRQHTSGTSSVSAPVPARLPLPDYGVKTVLAVCEDELLLREGVSTSSVHVSFTEGLDQLIAVVKERMPLRPGLVVALWHDRFGDGEHGVVALYCAPVAQLTLGACAVLRCRRAVRAD